MDIDVVLVTWLLDLSAILTDMIAPVLPDTALR
jgi:hypothetical protein